MGEGVRLKNENVSQNLIHQQSNHPQHPQQTIHTEKLLKETEDYNIRNILNKQFTLKNYLKKQKIIII